MLLETVIATGMLIVGLAVIGVQVQSADMSIKEMRREYRAMSLGEMQLAWLDMGLVKLESFDEVEEGDFGPRYPDYGWRLTSEPTSVEGQFVQKLEVLYFMRAGTYEPDHFEYDLAEPIHVLYSIRSAPPPLSLADDFGLDETKKEELSKKLDNLGIEGVSIDDLDPAILAKLDFEEFMKVLPLIADALGIDINAMAANLPPELLNILETSGVLDQEDDSSSEGADTGDKTQDGADQ